MMFGLSIKNNPDARFYEVSSGGECCMGFAIDESDAIRRARDEMKAPMGKSASVREIDENFDREELPFSMAGFVSDEPVVQTVSEPPEESDETEPPVEF